MTADLRNDARDLAAVVKQQQNDLLDLALSNASHEETISRLEDEITRVRAAQGKGVSIESSRVDELMSGIEMMAGHLEEDERQRANALQGLQTSVYAALQTQSGSEAEMKVVENSLGRLESSVASMQASNHDLMTDAEGGGTLNASQLNSEREQLTRSLLDSERTAQAKTAESEQLASQLQRSEGQMQQQQAELNHLRQHVHTVLSQKEAAEAESHAIGKQMDALREQLVAQFGRKRASEIAVAAMGHSTSMPTAAREPSPPPVSSSGPRGQQKMSPVLLRALLLMQGAIRVWRRSLLVVGFVCWKTCLQNRHSVAMVASYQALQHDVQIAQHQLGMAAQKQGLIVGRSRSSGIQVLDGFFAKAVRRSVSSALEGFRQNYALVAGFVRGQGEQRMNTLVTMGSMLTSWKGRNARGRRTLAGLTRLIMYTALPDAVALTTSFAHWRVAAVIRKSQKAGNQNMEQVEAAARSKTAALSTKLEMMVRQAAGVERMQSMIRAVDTAAASRFMGEWKVFKVISENERASEEIRRQGEAEAAVRKSASASIVGHMMTRYLKGQQAQFFETWSAFGTQNKLVRQTAGATKFAVLLYQRGERHREVAWARWRERSVVARACQQVGSLRRVDVLLAHNVVMHAIQAVANWSMSQLLAKARRLRDLDVGKVAWRYQSFGHHLVGAQLCANHWDKVRMLRLAPALTKWKERSFFHVVPPHRYSYQAFGRQMVGAQQVANILDRHRILIMIHAMSAWGEVVFSRMDHANTFVMSPNQFVVGQQSGGLTSNMSGMRARVDQSQVPDEPFPSPITENATPGPRGSSRAEFEQLRDERRRPISQSPSPPPTIGLVPGIAPTPDHGQSFEDYNPAGDDNFINPEEYRLFG